MINQLTILKYFFQNKRSLNYLEYGITEDIFSSVPHQALFQIYKKYVEKYNHVPDKLNFLEFMRVEGVKDHHVAILGPSLDEVYEPVSDVAMVEKQLLIKLKERVHEKIIQEAFASFDNFSEEALEKTAKKLNMLARLDVHGAPKYHPLLKSLLSDQHTLPDVHPTCFKALNNIIGLGGFFAPQLVCFLKGPKSMGTTFMLHMAVGYVEKGLNVAYLDWENGKSQTQVVLQQILTRSRVQYLYEERNKETLKERIEKISASNADLFYSKLRAKRDTVNDASVLIDQYFDDNGILPDVIFYDYLDITGRPKSMDKREGIQMAYAEAKTLNEHCNAFGITISKITRGSKSKEFLTEDDSAEDSEKAYNVDAMFAIRREPEDIELGIGHITPIVQRNGKSHVEEKATLEFIGETRYIGDLDSVKSDINPSAIPLPPIANIRGEVMENMF